MTKIIHIHLFFPKNKAKRDFYFGSFSAINEVLSNEEIGIKVETLQHCNLKAGEVKMTKRSQITIGKLIRKKSQQKQ